MKNYIENIAFINQFLNKVLSNADRDAFTNRLETDLEFHALYNEQLVLIQGIKRAGLKTEILAAKQSYLQTKWLKFLGISGLCIAILFVVWTFFFKQKQTNFDNRPIIESNRIVVSDSVITEANQKEKTSIIDSVSIDEGIQETSIIKQPVLKDVVDSETTNQIDRVVLQDSIITNDTKSVVNNQNEQLKPFFETVKKTLQAIQINTEKAFTKTLQEGTILNIPAHAFIDSKTGKLVRGTIQLEVTKYYKLSDMLLGNLSTTSNNEQLETGGMLYIEAKKNQSDLKLKKPISIAFPYQNKKPNMQLFIGDKTDGGINWELESPQINAILSDTINSIRFIDEGEVEVPFDLVEKVPIFPGCEGETNNELKACFNKKMTEFIKENFNIEVARELGLTGMNRVNVFFKIDRAGAIFEVSLRASSVALGNEILRVINTLPKFRPALQRGKPVTVPYFIPFVFDLPGVTKNLPNVTLRSNDSSESSLIINRDSTLVFNIKHFDPNSFNAYEVSSYALSSAKLGWLNCDAFVRYRGQKVKYKFKLKNSEGTNVKMVFKSMSSILPSKLRSQDIDFGMVPKDEDVILVAVKKVDNILYLGIKETQTKEISELEFDFKPVTIDELKQEMMKLNNLFN